MYTNQPPAGAYRGYSSPRGVFAVEQQIDMIAEKLSIDPIDLRLRNLEHVGDINPVGLKIQSCAIDQCLEELRKTPEWRERMSANRSLQSQSSSEIKRGIGIAIAGRGCGWRAGYETPTSVYKANPDSPFIEVKSDGKVEWSADRQRPRLDVDYSCCNLTISEDGSVHATCGGASDMGQGLETVLCQIIAEELGIPPDHVSVTTSDTATGSYGWGANSSRQTLQVGRGAQIAAASAKEALFDIAASALKCGSDMLECKQGKIYHREDPGRFLSFRDAAWRSYAVCGSQPITVKGFYEVPGSTLDTEFCAMSYVAQLAVVDVDTGTGAIHVRKIISVHDSGTIINPRAAEGQVYGGVVQGIGRSVSERFAYKDGVTLNPSFLNFEIPGVLDVGECEARFVESYEPEGPFGAKAVGEFGLIPVGGTIANAVYNATGVRFHRLPITPEYMLNELVKKVDRMVETPTP